MGGTRQAQLLCPFRARQLNGKRADSTGGAGDGDGIPPPERDSANRCISRRSCHKQGASGFPGDVGRAIDEMSRFDDDELGLTDPVIREADDLLADDEAFHTSANLGDDASEIATLPRRERRRPALGHGPLANGCFPWINAGRLDPDQNLPRTRHWALDLYHLQHIDPPISIKPDCMRHRLPPLSMHGTQRFSSFSPSQNVLLLLAACTPPQMSRSAPSPKAAWLCAHSARPIRTLAGFASPKKRILPTGHARGYGLRSSTARPVTKSNGTETCMCTISHLPPILRKHVVQRSQKSVFCPVVKVTLGRLRLRVKATSSPTVMDMAVTS